MSGIGSDLVTPELALVDPELAKLQRQINDRKAAMTSSTPSNGTFFIDPAQPAPEPGSPELAAVPAAELEPVAVAAEPPAAEPVAVAPAPAPTPAPIPEPPPALVATLTDDGTTPMRDVPLGTLIFRAGLLAEEQLEDALQEGMRNGKRLGEVLLERGWLHERDLGRLLAGQKGLPFVEVRASDAEPAALQTIPEEKARLQHTLPLRYEDGQLVVAVADPSNELVLENLRRTLGSEPRLVVAPQSELIRAINEAYATVATPEPTPQEPTLTAPEPTVTTPEPTVAPPEPTPTLQPEPTLAPDPAPLQAQPAAAPVVTPLPTVLPPAESRDAEPVQAPLLQSPLVVEPPVEVVEPLAVEPPAVEPLSVELPVMPETPAPLVEQPAAPPEPAAVPEAVTPPEAAPVEPQPVHLEPLIPVSPLQPPVETLDPQPEPEAPSVPLLPPPAAEVPVESAPAPFEDVVITPAPPEVPVEAPVVGAPSEPTSNAIHVVLLRLTDSEPVEVGSFTTAAEAAACAQDVVRQISAAQTDGSWPFFGDRYLRPDAIVSVDLLEESPDKWLGSAVRTRWAND